MSQSTNTYLDNYSTQSLFPPFLEEGSRGPAVQILQVLLMREGFGKERGQAGLNPDGGYGSNTAAGVRWLQRQLGMGGKGIDGMFGQTTRVAYARKYGVDVNTIPPVKDNEGSIIQTSWFHEGFEQEFAWPPAHDQNWRAALEGELDVGADEDEVEGDWDEDDEDTEPDDTDEDGSGHDTDDD